MIDENYNLKISDFGFSFENSDQNLINIFQGSEKYKAPEIILKKNFDGFKADIFSLGIILFVLLTGNFPFKSARKFDICYMNIIRNKNENFWDLLKKKIFDNKEENLPSQDFRDLFIKMIQFEPNNRISIHDIFNHPWMQGNFPSKDKPNKLTKLTNKKHGRYDYDNILTKIQVNFINFLINLANDAVNTEFDSNSLNNLVITDFNKKDCNPDFFKYINYDAKKKIVYDYITNIFQNPIKDIIILDVSPKFKKLQSQSRLDYNKILYEKLIEKSQWFKDFLDLKYIDVFSKYYYNREKPLNKIEFKGKTIAISKKTKSFYYLLQKEKDLSKSIINSVKNTYLNESSIANPFTTTKNDN
jgi:serine/threonine protein kinase